jgi:FdhD protein
LRIDAFPALPEHPWVPDNSHSTTLSASIQKWKNGSLQSTINDELAVEEPLEIRVHGQSLAITMRTPGHDEELAAGFLQTEGIIKNQADLVEITRCNGGKHNQGENRLNISLSPNLEVDLESLSRHVFASSSCGLCGKATIESAQQNFDPIESNVRVLPRTITSLPALLRNAQPTFDQTGGLHAAAVFDAKGKIVVCREDVGRHNAVDKVVGYGFLNKLPFDKHILMVSGRTSFEIMQKALAARLPILAAVSAPSSLAVDFAQENGQTLIGFVRGETMNIYTHPRRIG